MNKIGNALRLTIFGASHDDFVGCTLEGLPEKTIVRYDAVSRDLELRKSDGETGTARIESDIPEINGVIHSDGVIHYEGVINSSSGELLPAFETTEDAITIKFKNTNVRKSDYANLKYVPRPSHADYPAYYKYGEMGIVSGGGIFSGRMTAPLVAAGAICREFLASRGINVGSYVSRIGNVVDEGVYGANEIIRVSCENKMRAMSREMETAMRAEVLAAKDAGDSVGGVVQVVATGLPIGLGEPFFDTLDGELAKAVFAIPGVKGISFGKGFDSAKIRGSENNDEYFVDACGTIQTRTNNAGGVLGGMASSAPLSFSVVFKPTSSIAKAQSSVDLRDKKNVTLKVQGRHDPCIAHRGAIVAEAMTCFVIADLMLRRETGAESKIVDAEDVIVKAEGKRIEAEHERLESMREKIADIDCEIMKLIGKRNAIAKEIGREKAKSGASIRALDVETRVVQRYVEAGERAGVSEETARRIARDVIDEAVFVQEKL